MEPLITFNEALIAMREGKAVTRLGWRQASASHIRTSLVLIAGREIEASFPPMVNHLGKGTLFTVKDHVDAIHRGAEGYIYTTVGYQFTQADILTNDWQIAVDADNVDAGWWHDIHTGQPLDRNIGELLCLVHSEVSEAYLGYVLEIQDDKLPHRKMVEVEMADVVIRVLDIQGHYGFSPYVIDGYRFEVTDNNLLGIHKAISDAMEGFRKKDLAKAEAHLALVIVLCESFCLARDLDLWGAIAEKRQFNKHRLDHKRENRAAAGGKAF